MKTAREIYNMIDKRVVGQAKAKKILSTEIMNHLQRCQHPEDEVKKDNIILIGPSGMGKTTLAKEIARALDIPFAIADATSLTQAGYVGEDVENVLLRLVQAADGDVRRAEQGIVFIDEFV